jgi:hypothetical protein
MLCIEGFKYTHPENKKAFPALAEKAFFRHQAFRLSGLF